MPTTTGSTPASPTPISGDLSQLQRWAQHTEVTLNELSLQIARVNNLLQNVISLNHLKSKP